MDDEEILEALAEDLKESFCTCALHAHDDPVWHLAPEIDMLNGPTPVIGVTIPESWVVTEHEGEFHFHIPLDEASGFGTSIISQGAVFFAELVAGLEQ